MRAGSDVICWYLYLGSHVVEQPCRPGLGEVMPEAVGRPACDDTGPLTLDEFNAARDASVDQDGKSSLAREPPTATIALTLRKIFQTENLQMRVRVGRASWQTSC